MNDLKTRIARREPTFGSWLNLGSQAVAEIMADAGFDWLVVDLEHSATSIREAESLIRIIDLKGVVPFVRVSANDRVEIKRVMDAGAMGVIVPMINSRADAESAVAAVKYPPLGERGVGIGRAQGYGPRFDQYMATANDTTILVAQIEHHRGIDSLAEIQAVEGIDATMIGPYDLSASVGKPGQFEDTQVKTLLGRYESVSRSGGKPMGFHVVFPDYEQVRARLCEGYSFIAISVDFLFLGLACRDTLARLRSSSRPTPAA